MVSYMEFFFVAIRFVDKEIFPEMFIFLNGQL